MTEARKKLAIIDGKSVFYRGYYAMPNLSTKDGTPTGGVYGFAVMALEVIKRLKPDYVCVAWDKPKTNIRARLKLYPEYKAGRKPAPEDFKIQIPLLHELLKAFGWPLYELDDYEADDIMGTLAVQAKDKDVETMLITSDLDMLQLVNGHTHVYALKKGFSNIELFRPETFIFKYGIKPTQFLDLKALKGDSSDNIPGVAGVGEKTAIELLKEYKTLDNIYDNIELIKETTRKKLVADKDMAYLSKKLGAIWTDAPLKLNLTHLDGSRTDPDKILEVLKKLEFRTLASQLPEIMQVSDSKKKHVTSIKEQVGAAKNTFIKTDKELNSLVLPSPGEVVVHSSSQAPHGRGPLTFTFSSEAKQAVTIDLSALEFDQVSAKLSKYLEACQLIGYDIKNTIQTLKTIGINPTDIAHDVLIGAFLINPLRRVQSLEELAGEELNIHLDSEDMEPSAIVAVVRGLWEKQAKELAENPSVAKLAKVVEWPIIPVLASMEYEGIQLDTSYLKLMAAQVDDMVSDLEQQIYGYADMEFNIASPAQLSEVLFEKMNLPTTGIKKGKTAFSTAANELEKLRGKHEVIDLISQYREVTKLKNTYIDTFPKMVDENSRLHTTFKLTIAQTGRLSSTEPNLQNIPVRTELGKRIRTAFVAREGNVLVSADYSQFELRIAAVLSKDEDMIKLFNEDADIHTITAAQIYQRDPEDVSKNMRRDAKVVNFGVMYGLSAHGLSESTGITHEQAQHFITRFFEVRPKLLKYIESIREQAKTKGYVETMYGRRRPTPDVHSSNFVVRESAMRAAVNMPFQGTAADIMKMAMVKVQENLDKSKVESPKSKLLLQIHDSLIVECLKEDADNVAKLLRDTMEKVVKLPVKLTVDTSIGENWGEL